MSSYQDRYDEIYDVLLCSLCSTPVHDDQNCDACGEPACDDCIEKHVKNCEDAINESNELLCYCGATVTLDGKQVQWNGTPHKCYHVDPVTEFCRCELCGQLTPMMGTKRCDRCWELERRMHHDPVLAKKIMEAMDE